MATSYIRGDGTGDYLLPSAWAAACAGLTGEIGIMDHAETFVDTVVFPACTGCVLRANANVRIQQTTLLPLTLNTATTGLIVEATAGNTLSFYQLNPTNKQAVTFGAGSSVTFKRCHIEGPSYGVYAAVTSTGLIRFEDCTISAPTGMAIRITTAQQFQVERCTIIAGSLGIRSRWTGYVRKTKMICGEYPFGGGYLNSIAVGGNSSIDRCCFVVNSSTMGPWISWLIDQCEIPVGSTLSIHHVTIVGDDANVRANCVALETNPSNPPPYGSLDIKNVTVSGFSLPLRSISASAGQDYFNWYDCVGGPTGSGYAPGTHDMNVDPTFEDAGAGDYRLGVTSPLLGAGVALGYTDDLDGTLFASPPPIGAYASSDATRPDVSGAIASDINTIVVTFSEAVTGTGLVAPLSWSLVRESTLASVTITGIVQTASDTVVVSCASMQQETQYRITAPATITDIVGNLINIRVALFTTARYLTAYHESEQGLRVVFDAAVKQVNDLETDDALNVANYYVARDDAGRFPALLAVIPRSSTEVTLKFAGPEVNRFEYATVSVAGTIAYIGGGTFPNVACRYEGCAEPLRPLMHAVETSVGIRDLMMPQFGTEAGTLPVKSGDYQIETATETMKKMCIRALTIAAGEFAHAPDFGSAAKVKAIAKPSELQRVSRDAKKSLLSLPNVLDAVVTTTAYNNGVLWVQATVRTRHLGTVSVSWAPAGAV